MIQTTKERTKVAEVACSFSSLVFIWLNRIRDKCYLNLSDFILLLLTVTLTVKTKNPRKFLTYKGNFDNLVARKGSFSNPFLTDLRRLAS